MRICASSSSPSCRRLASSRSIEAESGERAWAVLREANPDVVVLDWMMEGMSGLDLVKMIRTDAQTPNPFVPVIMLTGHTHIDRVRQARDAGINEFIAKPVSVKTMMSRLDVGDRKSPPLRPHQELFRSLPPPAGQQRISRTRAPRRESRPGGGIRESKHGPPTADRTLHAAQYAEGEGRRHYRAASTWPRSTAPKPRWMSLKSEFADWAQDDVRRLVAARDAFAANPDAATRAGLLRAAHDMKGQAATFNYPLIARVAGSLSHLIHDLPAQRRAVAGTGGCACQRHPCHLSRQGDGHVQQAWRWRCPKNWKPVWPRHWAAGAPN